MARNPAAPARAKTARSMIPSRSNSSARGTTSFSRNRRKLSRNMSCSESKRSRRMRPSSPKSSAEAGTAGEDQVPRLTGDPAEGVDGLGAGELGGEPDLDVGQMLHHRPQRLGQQVDVEVGFEPAGGHQGGQPVGRPPDEPLADRQPQPG